MNSNIFFDFRSKFLPSTVHAIACNLKKDEKGLSSHWNLIKGDFQAIEVPVTFQIESGKNFLDILETGWPSLYLISHRFKTVLEEGGLTGWMTFPIKLLDKNNNPIQGYYGLSIKGTCSHLDYKGCEIIEKKWVEGGPVIRFYKGIPIQNWDGKDFFSPNGTFEIFISKKAADLLKKNKITNLVLLNTQDTLTDVNDV